MALPSPVPSKPLVASVKLTDATPPADSVDTTYATLYKSDADGKLYAKVGSTVYDVLNPTVAPPSYLEAKVATTSLNPRTVNTCTCNGTVGRITLDLTSGGGAWTVPYVLTINNSSVAAGDIILLTLSYAGLYLKKDTPLFVELNSQGANAFSVVFGSTVATPAGSGSANLYLNFMVIKAS
jgi:hypothetical protein